MARNHAGNLGYFLPRGTNIGGCKEKGRGSYGSVHMVTINRVKCIAKRIHEILLQPECDCPSETMNVVSKKFRQECELMNSLRHPNIVQCLGIHTISTGDNLPEEMLVMEYMHMDLDHCLKTYPNIALPIKTSILRDVAHGLLHLHSQDPPIVHRDLTASNILLTPDMRAKIADLGVSKIFDLRQIQALTMAPGTYAYMPPEALTEEPDYDTKLDIFSFGVVVLYAGIQVFPTVFEVKILSYPLQLLKRKRWMDTLGNTHPLYPLVTKCLQDDPRVRPSILDICSEVENLCDNHPWDFKDILKACNVRACYCDKCLVKLSLILVSYLNSCELKIASIFVMHLNIHYKGTEFMISPIIQCKR